MTATVLDASALIALILDEPGADEVARCVEEAAISSVNLAEEVAILPNEEWTPTNLAQ